MNESAGLLQQGLSLINQAIDLDKQQKYVEAIRYYDSAIKCFSDAYNFEKDPSTQTVLRNKIAEYTNRLQAIQSALGQTNQNMGSNFNNAPNMQYQNMNIPYNNQPNMYQPTGNMQYTNTSAPYSMAYNNLSQSAMSYNNYPYNNQPNTYTGNMPAYNNMTPNTYQNYTPTTSIYAMPNNPVPVPAVVPGVALGSKGSTVTDSVNHKIIGFIRGGSVYLKATIFDNYATIGQTIKIQVEVNCLTTAKNR